MADSNTARKNMNDAAKNTVAAGQGSSADSKPDVQAIMAEIRARVKADIAKNADKKMPFISDAANFDGKAKRKAGELVQSEELRYLNSNYGFSSKLQIDTIKTHRSGFLGKLIVKFKQKALRVLWDSLLKEYFQGEREYFANLVRYLNDISRYVDERDAGNFWELIRKIDVDVGRSLERIDRATDEQIADLRDVHKSVLHKLSQEVARLEAKAATSDSAIEQFRAELKTLLGVVGGLEGIIARYGRTTSEAASLPSAPPAPVIPDCSYLLLENRYRGSEVEIASRIGIYPPLFAGQSASILEIGPGRGELLSLFKNAGLRAYGVETDKAMVDVCHERGLEAILGDGIAHLRELTPKSLGGVIAIQVVEHLKPQTIAELLSLCADKVVPGGVVVFETINPKSLTALSSNYFRDLSHVQPLHPDTLAYLMTLHGLEVTETKYLSPVPQSACLRTLPVSEHCPPQYRDMVEVLNYNLTNLNELLYGCQDYCVVARAK